MKKYLTLIIILSITCSIVYAQKFEKIKEIDISTNVFAETVNYYATIFNYSNRKPIGKYFAFDIYDIIKPYLQDMTQNDKDRLIFTAQNSDGKLITFTYHVIDPDITVIPPVLIYTKKVKSMKDTVNIFEKKGKIDFEGVEEFGRSLTKRSVYLQINSLTKEEKNRIFYNTTIVFPQDKSTVRWIDGINKICIYLLKNED